MHSCTAYEVATEYFEEESLWSGPGVEMECSKSQKTFISVAYRGTNSKMEAILKLGGFIHFLCQ